jgi:hypothetical protein
MQASRRQEHGPADAGGSRAQQAGKLEARALFAGSQGGAVARAGGNACGPLSARLDLTSYLGLNGFIVLFSIIPRAYARARVLAHFNKRDDVKSALLRVSDSIAYVAAARHVYAVLDDPENKDSNLFVKAKNNLAPDKKALRYGRGG